MFKFFLYIPFCICLIYVSFVNTHDPALEVLGAGEYCIYSRDVVTSNLITKRIDSGIGYIYYCDSSDAAALRPLFKKIDGESIILENCSMQRVYKILNYKKVGSHYGYSNRGRAFIKDGNTKINLQVVQRGDVTVVGWPVILGSY